MANTQAEVKRICESKQNINIIQDYLTNVEGDESVDALQSIRVLRGVFSFYIRKRTWKDLELIVDDDEVKSPSNVVNLWLRSAFKSFVEMMHNRLLSEAPEIQTECLVTLMHLLQEEYKVTLNSATVSGSRKLCYPNQSYMKILKGIFKCQKLSSETKQSLKELLSFDDNRYYSLKNIHSLLQQNSKNSIKTSLSFVENVCDVLSMISKFEISDKTEVNLYCFNEDDANGISLDELDVKEIVDNYKHVFSNAWLSLLRVPNLPSDLLKKILANLDSNIMPKLSDPKLLIDFLSDAYDLGGVLSLLALNGLFVLINQYNLDYPHFYKKLYNLLEPNIFHVKYKSRFFYLLDLFLSSTHLPAYLVSAFVKKLSRMSLFTPSPDMEMLLVLIRNLLIRHPSCRILIHRKNAKISTDPYIYEETDPSKCNAIKSCLWEITTLQSHYSSGVKKLVASYKKDLPKLEQDISNFFEKSYEDQFQHELKETAIEDSVPLNFEKSKTIFSTFDEEMWTLE